MKVLLCLILVAFASADSFYQRFKEGKVTDGDDSHKYYKRYKTTKKSSKGSKVAKNPPKVS
jgi:hypothetical protein